MRNEIIKHIESLETETRTLRSVAITINAGISKLSLAELDRQELLNLMLSIETDGTSKTAFVDLSYSCLIDNIETFAEQVGLNIEELIEEFDFFTNAET